ncbi:MAG TPA: plastocyanin/azurin family copper-binding protein [Gemmatimonadales bacterium]
MRPVVFAAVLCILAACKSATGPGGPHVSITEYQFSPDTLTVKAGSTVTWTNNGTVDHSVTSDTNSAAPFASPTLSPAMGGGYGGGTGPGGYGLTFHTAGTYPYHCSFHPTLMHGTIVVTP